MISADEKTSIQARHRSNPTLPAGEGRKTRVEHEYERGGALAYLAAWDVHRARLFGRCEAKNGIEPFGRDYIGVERDHAFLKPRKEVAGLAIGGDQNVACPGGSRRRLHLEASGAPGNCRDGGKTQHQGASGSCPG